MNVTRPWICIPLCSATLFTLTAHAAVNNEVVVGAASVWEDNVFRDSTNRESDISNRVYAILNADEDMGSYHYGASYDIEYRWYVDSSYDSATYLNGSAFADFLLLNRRLNWDNRIASAVSMRNASEPNTPDNIDQRNSIYTAPSINIINTQRDRLALGAHATKLMYREASDNDSTRYGADATYSHQFTQLFSGGLNCVGEKTEFKTESNYESHSCSITTSRVLNGGNVSLNVGKSRINPEVGEEIDGLIYQFRANWSSELWGWYLSSLRSITDTTVGLGLLLAQEGNNAFTSVDTNTDLAVLTTRTRTELGLDYSINSAMTLSGVAYRDLDDIELDGAPDTLRKGASIFMEKDFPNNISTRLAYYFERTEIELIETTDYVSRYSFRLAKDFSNQLQVALELDAEDRRADLQQDEYEVYGVSLDGSFTF